MVAMCEALVRAKMTLLHIWLKMLFFPSVWPLIWCVEYKGLPEVVTPLRVAVSNRDKSLGGWMSYSLHFGGQRHIISVKSNNFLISRQLSVFTHNDQGDLFEDKPFVQNDCYYLGFVDGNPESIVALNTCFGGFQGTLQINDTTYEIKPRSPSSTFEHLVYKIDLEETRLLPMRCGLTDEEIAGQLRLQENDKSSLMRNYYGRWWAHRRYIKLALVIDHEQFLYRKSNSSLVIKDVFNIMNGLNIFLLPVNINVALIGLYIWTKENPIPVKDLYTLLPAFCKWKRENIKSQVPHDIAHLFVKYNFTNYFGIAYVGTVCNKTFGCGVDSLLGDSFFTAGHIVAHEISHNLGIPHDGKLCTCGGGSCFMAATTNTSRKFSNCSYAVMWANTARTGCLHSKPSPSDTHPLRLCGNGVVDEGEQCDCGSSEACEYSLCCTSDCTLRFGTNCDTGGCCSHLCKILPSGTLCRQKENECDLPEWCNGTSNECPEDVFKQDGSSCRNEGYCYNKRCNSRDLHCQRVFGKDANKASDSCYQEMNMRGDRFGNCGITNNAYLRCNSSNILCGRIQCKGVNRLPFWRGHYSAHWTHFNSVPCWTIDYHIGMSIPDLGEIKDGTDCGQGHVCINRECVDMRIWKSGCSAKTCNMKGVCNNKHHCHCDTGWGPPYCKVTGNGGSIDSGPSSGDKKKESGNENVVEVWDGGRKEKETGKEKEKKKEQQKNNLISWIFAISFVVLLLLLFVCLFESTEPSHEKEETKTTTGERRD